MKIKLMVLLAMLPLSVVATESIQPVIQGKVYQDWYMKPEKLAKPNKVIKGGRDECNDRYFPDQWKFGSYTVLANGQIQEVYFRDNNTVIFHHQRIPYNLDQAAFKKKFKNHIFETDDKNVIDAGVEGSNDSIEFIFKNGKLFKYRLNIDDC